MILLRKKPRLRVAILLAISLLCAQYAAQAHAYSHLRTDTDVSRPGSSGWFCPECLASAALLTAAGSHSYPPLIAPQGIEPAPTCDIRSLVGRCFPAAFRSRAPPLSR